MSSAKQLREGFTTGSACAAAAKAGLVFLLAGKKENEIDIPCPPHATDTRLRLPVEQILPGAFATQARVAVIKDGGDDPDATHGARLWCVVELLATIAPQRVELLGGKGVGTVTLPGLPVAVGEPAINPSPREQIIAAALEAMDQAQYTGCVRLLLEVENGEQIAKKTLNPRLGITGGISILGTGGKVKPFSHDAWKASISECLDVAKATGCNTAALTTGRRSERFLGQHLTGLPPLSFVQAADFFAFALKQAATRGFPNILWSCFFGKLVKMAQGNAYTHAHTALIDFEQLALSCRNAGIAPETSALVATANTGMHAFQLFQEAPNAPALLKSLLVQAMSQARKHCGPTPALGFYLFDFNGELLACRQEKGQEQAS